MSKLDMNQIRKHKRNNYSIFILFFHNELSIKVFTFVFYLLGKIIMVTSFLQISFNILKSLQIS